MTKHVHTPPGDSPSTSEPPTIFCRRTAIFGAMALAAAPVAALPALAADPDPILAAIKRHRAAEAAFQASFDESANMVRIPYDIAERQSAAGDAETEARYDMHQVVPTTMAGLAAYVAYWHAYTSPPGLRLTQLEEIGWEAVPTIAEAMANLAMEVVNV